MEIIVGKTAGFCYGVKNAKDKTENVLKENKENKVYCLGELVHNKQVVEKLENMGLTVIENVEELPKSDNKNNKVIIRAHGVGKEIYEKVEELNYQYVDLTCPNVLSIHKIVQEYIKNGYYVLLIGQKNHPEVLGTYGWCDGKCSIVETGEDIEEICKKIKSNKILVVAQTTFSLEKFNKFVEIIKTKLNTELNELEVRNTICNATKLRQEETEKISKEVEAMVIIGGKNSSNTKKLYDIANKITNAILVETAAELNLEDIKKYKKIGIMAGASTPKESIDECIETLKSI